MSPILLKALAFLPDFFARFKIRLDSGPLETVDELSSFVATRSAFIAQKTLYGYLKTRMGTRYPSMFEDDVFVSSIDIAKMHVFAGCLSDLALFAASRALHSESSDENAYRWLAHRWWGRRSAGRSGSFLRPGRPGRRGRGRRPRG